LFEIEVVVKDAENVGWFKFEIGLNLSLEIYEMYVDLIIE